MGENQTKTPTTTTAPTRRRPVRRTVRPQDIIRFRRRSGVNSLVNGRRPV